MSAAEALVRLGASTAEAIAKVLDGICPEPVERGDVTVVDGEDGAFAALELPAVAVSVAYVDGVTGGNVLLTTPAGARRLAAAMSGAPAPEDDAAELSEIELSAVAEAANLVMAAAASATGIVLGQDVEIAPPQTRVFADAAELREAYDATPHATSTDLRVLGEPWRLVQLVPNAFVVRMTRALGEQGAERHADGHATDGGDVRSLAEALRDIRVRVWAELGRTHVALGRAPELPAGTVLELDRNAEDPVDLYVNGLRFGSGRLVLTDEGEWALRLIEVAGREALTRELEGAVT